MKHCRITVIILAALVIPGLFAFRRIAVADARMVSIRVDPKLVRLYWKDDKGQIIGSLDRLRQHVQAHGAQLQFAMNGGMYQEDQSPLGLYVEEGKQLAKLNTARDLHGNFYLQPNGVFGIERDGKAFICRTAAVKIRPGLRFATQSGPMLVIDGAIHPAFRKGSANVNIRNGVGVLPDGRLVLAMSREAISLYDFACYFRDLGCRNALYLDGFVSRAYYPAGKWVQQDGHFGVMIGVLSK